MHKQDTWVQQIMNSVARQMNSLSARCNARNHHEDQELRQRYSSGVPRRLQIIKQPEHRACQQRRHYLQLSEKQRQKYKTQQTPNPKPRREGISAAREISKTKLKKTMSHAPTQQPRATSSRAPGMATFGQTLEESMEHCETRYK